MDLNPLPLPRPLPLPPGEEEFFILSFVSITRSDFNRDIYTNDHLNVVGKYHEHTFTRGVAGWFSGPSNGILQ